jgi:hypothetical protein
MDKLDQYIWIDRLLNHSEICDVLLLDMAQRRIASHHDYRHIKSERSSHAIHNNRWHLGSVAPAAATNSLAATPARRQSQSIRSERPATWTVSLA